MPNKPFLAYFIFIFFRKPVIVTIVRNSFSYNEYLIFIKVRLIWVVLFYKLPRTSFFFSLSAKTETFSPILSGPPNLFSLLLSLFLSDLSLLPKPSCTLFSLWKSYSSINYLFLIHFFFYTFWRNIILYFLKFDFK